MAWGCFPELLGGLPPCGLAPDCECCGGGLVPDCGCCGAEFGCLCTGCVAGLLFGCIVSRGAECTGCLAALFDGGLAAGAFAAGGLFGCIFAGGCETGLFCAFGALADALSEAVSGLKSLGRFDVLYGRATAAWPGRPWLTFAYRLRSCDAS